MLAYRFRPNPLVSTCIVLAVWYVVIYRENILGDTSVCLSWAYYVCTWYACHRRISSFLDFIQKTTYLRVRDNCLFLYFCTNVYRIIWPCFDHHVYSFLRITRGDRTTNEACCSWSCLFLNHKHGHIVTTTSGSVLFVLETDTVGRWIKSKFTVVDKWVQMESKKARFLWSNIIVLFLVISWHLNPTAESNHPLCYIWWLG